MNTFQNYLKSMKQRIEYEVEKNKKMGLPMAFKMVRGAYITEERELAEQKGLESPICDTFEDTTKSMHGNIEHILRNFTP